ncbi:MAG: glycerol-3-phosphate 1-O-acyltransferase PlsY [Chloroflexota bacterium]|nr:glycerol-3-phosphate 1-O-acyltransferase PlsY [Chloroflexota bacterium]
MSEIEFIIVVIGSYLIGSIPSGVLLGKIRGVDVRAYGSGKTGSTNVLRTLGTKAAAIALIADVLKGVIAVLIAKYTLGSPVGEMAAGFAAIAGHDWSIFIRFQGGRGVATSVGALFVMAPLVAAASLAIFALIVAVTRYASLGSLLGATSAVVIMAVLSALDMAPVVYVIFTAVAVALIIIQHRDNISRLLSGTESKVGQKGEKRQN